MAISGDESLRNHESSTRDTRVLEIHLNCQLSAISLQEKLLWLTRGNLGLICLCSRQWLTKGHGTEDGVRVGVPVSSKHISGEEPGSQTVNGPVMLFVAFVTLF